MILQVTRDGVLPTVQRRVAEAVDSTVRYELQRDKIATGAADDHTPV